MTQPPLNARSTAKHQSAYIARNRSRMIRDAQEVLAEVGLEATMEQLASSIVVSPTTIYKYFGSKEALFSEAIVQIWQDWLAWSCEVATPCASFDSWVITSRKFLRVKQTHPFFGRILSNILRNPEFLRYTQRGPSEMAIRQLAKREEISNEDLEVKILLWAQAEAGIFSGVHATGVLTPLEADYALGLSLKLFNVSEDRIQRLLAAELDLSVVSSR